MCPRRGVETHFRKASTPSVLYISTTYMSHANLCDFACLIAASPRSCSLDSSKSFSSGLIGTFGTMNQASITMPPLEYAFQRGRMLFRYGCLKSCNSCSPSFQLSIAGRSPRRKARRSRKRRSSAGDQKKRPDLNATVGRSGDYFFQLRLERHRRRLGETVTRSPSTSRTTLRSSTI
jgi:hypothetical protein